MLAREGPTLWASLLFVVWPFAFHGFQLQSYKELCPLQRLNLNWSVHWPKEHSTANHCLQSLELNHTWHLGLCHQHLMGIFSNFNQYCRQIAPGRSLSTPRRGFVLLTTCPISLTKSLFGGYFINTWGVMKTYRQNCLGGACHPTFWPMMCWQYWFGEQAVSIEGHVFIQLDLADKAAFWGQCMCHP